MSRVSDAMRRAGRDDEQESATPDENAGFESGEDAVPSPDEYDAADRYKGPVEPPTAEPIRALAPVKPVSHLVTSPPIEMIRRDPGESEEVRIKDILRILNRRRWLITAIVAASLAIAAIYNYTQVPMYEARARVLVQPTRPQAGPFRNAGEDPGREDYFVTQIEVLRSRSMARKTLERLNLLSSDPRRQASQIGQFLGARSVTPFKSEVGESRVINVAYKSPDPRTAARLANALTQAYEAENLEGMRAGSRQASAFLNEHLEKLKQAVRDADGALQQYREQQDAVSLEEGQNVVVQTFAQFTAAASAAKTERLSSESLYRQLEGLEAKGALDTFPPIQASQPIQSLKAELRELEQTRLKLSEQQLPTNPEMIAVSNQISSKREQLNGEMGKVVARVRQEYSAAQAKEQALRETVAASERAVSELGKKSIGYNALQRNAESAQKILETVLQQSKEIQIAGELPANNVEVLDPAEVPGGPISPRKGLNLAIGFLGGCFLAVGLVFVLEFMRPRLAEPEHIAATLGLPLLGIAPQVAELSDRRASLNELPVNFQEAIRSIRTQIFLSAGSSGARTLAVTSSRPGEGKTVVSSSLAVSMAMAGRRVLLIDADLRRAQLRHVFNIPRAPGLSNIITGEVKPSQALVESSVKGLFVLPAGDEMANPGDMLDSERLHQLIEGLKHVFDLVVIDCPPVMAVADASIVASAATSVVFVVGSGTTRPEVARLAIDRLVSVQAQVIGVVLNKAKTDSRSDYYYPYQATEDTA